MKYIRSVFGNWSSHHVKIIEGHGIKCEEGYFGFTLNEDEKYFKLIPYLENAKEFSTRRAIVIIDREELDHSNRFLLHNFDPEMVYPARLTKDDDGAEYLRYAFGEICSTCNGIPKGEQINPFTFASEPKLSKKHIWGGIHWTSGYIFTDTERYKILNQRWGLQKREVLIGAKQKISKSFVQIEVPISNSPLCFGNSDFGNTFRLDDSGEIDNIVHICPECSRPLYTNQILDFFPSFYEEVNDDIVFTKEWFGWYRRLVISRKFADWLLENKYLKWNSNFLIPVKDFCK
jgi:hypothetical protein